MFLGVVVDLGMIKRITLLLFQKENKMKKPLAIMLVFSLLSPYLVSAQSNPCQDKEFLRLKDANINDMTDREYQYFLMMSEECVDDNDEKKSMLKIKLKPKLLWLIIGTAVIYSVYDEVIDDGEHDHDEEH